MKDGMIHKAFAQYIKDTMERDRISQNELAKRSGVSQATISLFLAGHIRGLSQTILAEKLGCSLSDVSLMESGQRLPSMDMITKFSAFFNCNPVWLKELVLRDTNIADRERRRIEFDLE